MVSIQYTDTHIYIVDSHETGGNRQKNDLMHSHKFYNLYCRHPTMSDTKRFIDKIIKENRFFYMFCIVLKKKQYDVFYYIMRFR